MRRAELERFSSPYDDFLQPLAEAEAKKVDGKEPKQPKIYKAKTSIGSITFYLHL